MAAPERRDCRHETSPSALRSPLPLRLRRLPVPTRRHRRCGPLVPAVRPVLPRRRGTPRRARRRGRPRQRLPLGPAVHAAAGRGRPPVPACGGRSLVGGRAYVKVSGQWRYVYRAVDQFGQVIDVFISARRDAKAARRFFERAIGVTKVAPVEVTTDQAPVYPAVLEELLPAAWHRTEQYGNNRVECDHGRLKARLRPMRGLKRDGSARVIIAGHALVQNVRRGHYELAAEVPATRRLAVAFGELVVAI